MNFKLAFTTREAAKYSVENWHYSKCLPAGKLVIIGVWENEKFIGVIIYSCGACPNIADPFGLDRTEICELTRIALNRHENPVSKFLGISLRIIKKMMPKLKLVVSYADPEQDHHVGIYQATNWIYLGATKPATHFISDKGFRIHSKTINTRGRGTATRLKAQGKIKTIKCFKHKYVYCLDKKLIDDLKLKSKPYPRKLCRGSTADFQSAGGVQIDLSASLSDENA